MSRNVMRVTAVSSSLLLKGFNLQDWKIGQQVTPPSPSIRKVAGNHGLGDRRCIPFNRMSSRNYFLFLIGAHPSA